MAYGIAQSKMATVSEVMQMTLDEVLDLSEFLDIHGKAQEIMEQDMQNKQR